MRDYNEKAPSPKNDKGDVCAKMAHIVEDVAMGVFKRKAYHDNITRSLFFLYTEEGEKFIQEDNSKLYHNG